MSNLGDDAFVAAMMRAHPEIQYTGPMDHEPAPRQQVPKHTITCKQESFDTIQASERDPVEVIHRDVINVSSDIDERLNVARSLNPRLSISETIIKIVAYASGFEERELKSARRHNQLVRWRQICMYMLYQHTGMSTPAIGRRLGGRDHSTVLHALKKINGDYESFRTEIELVENFL